MGIDGLEGLAWIRAFRKGNGSAYISPGLLKKPTFTYCNPSAPLAGFESIFSDFPIFEIEGVTKSALRFAEPLLFGVFALGVNPSNLVQ